MSQSTYAKKLVERFRLSFSKLAETPMSTTLKLSKDTAGTKVDEKIYREMIGSLLYLEASRPGYSFSVRMCARYQASPQVSHLNAVKRIIKYMHGTVNYGIS